MGDSSSDPESQKGKELPVDSPSNLFTSPVSGSRKNLPSDSELLQTVLKLNDLHQQQFSQLSEKYEHLMSIFTSEKATLRGRESVSPPEVNKDYIHEEDNMHYSKQIVEQTLNAVTPFEVGKARQDGTVVKTFFRSLQEVFDCMDLGTSLREERKKVILLKSKMSDTNATTEWYN